MAVGKVLAKARAAAQAKKKKEAAKAEPGAGPMKMHSEEIPMRSLLDEGRDAIQLAREAYPAVLDLQQKYGPDFARSETAIGEARGVAESEAIRRSGGKMRESILASSPEISQANASLLDQLRSLGPTSVEKELQRQAGEELALGGRLSAEETRGAVQSARAGMSARGRVSGTPAALAEVLNRDTYSRGRAAERRGFAGAVESQVAQRRSLDAGIANNTFNTLGSFWDPQIRLFGKGGSAVSGQVSGPSAFGSYLNAAQNVAQGNQAAAATGAALDWDQDAFARNMEFSRWATLYNADQSNANAAAQRKSAATGAAVSAGASVASAAILAFALM